MAACEEEGGWAGGLLVCVSSMPREQRALVQQLIERAGGR